MGGGLLSWGRYQGDSLSRHTHGLLAEHLMYMAHFTGNTLRVTSSQNENVVIKHFPPCLSKPVKALFVFGTQFKIFLMKTGRLVTAPSTAK